MSVYSFSYLTGDRRNLVVCNKSYFCTQVEHNVIFAIRLNPNNYKRKPILIFSHLLLQVFDPLLPFHASNNNKGHSQCCLYLLHVLDLSFRSIKFCSVLQRIEIPIETNSLYLCQECIGTLCLAPEFKAKGSVLQYLHQRLNYWCHTYIHTYTHIHI